MQTQKKCFRQESRHWSSCRKFEDVLIFRCVDHVYPADHMYIHMDVLHEEMLIFRCVDHVYSADHMYIYMNVLHCSAQILLYSISSLT